jgi:putative membrane protein
MVVCAIAPTVFYNKHSKSEEEVIEVPQLLRLLLRFQLVLLVLIPVLSLLMARGIGISS